MATTRQLVRILDSDFFARMGKGVEELGDDPRWKDLREMDEVLKNQRTGASSHTGQWNAGSKKPATAARRNNNNSNRAGSGGNTNRYGSGDSTDVSVDWTIPQPGQAISRTGSLPAVMPSTSGGGDTAAGTHVAAVAKPVSFDSGMKTVASAAPRRSLRPDSNPFMSKKAIHRLAESRSGTRDPLEIVKRELRQAVNGITENNISAQLDTIRTQLASAERIDLLPAALSFLAVQLVEVVTLQSIFAHSYAQLCAALCDAYDAFAELVAARLRAFCDKIISLPEGGNNSTSLFEEFEVRVVQCKSPAVFTDHLCASGHIDFGVAQTLLTSLMDFAAKDNGDEQQKDCAIEFVCSFVCSRLSTRSEDCGAHAEVQLESVRTAAQCLVDLREETVKKPRSQRIISNKSLLRIMDVSDLLRPKQKK